MTVSGDSHFSAWHARRTNEDTGLIAFSLSLSLFHATLGNGAMSKLADACSSQWRVLSPSPLPSCDSVAGSSSFDILVVFSSSSTLSLRLFFSFIIIIYTFPFSPNPTK
ncbi:hypothetical protein TTRE_0000544601 [Trichuris trichiura]|uniref:Uncharacterized protein n=1 Tax=Trichuris trichiura TaxID=36087 RepID=A0A077ZBI1_TRITR|nr:hypothetical protein TTRE_0000544601 [Trichuris trichiura]